MNKTLVTISFLVVALFGVAGTVGGYALGYRSGVREGFRQCMAASPEAIAQMAGQGIRAMGDVIAGLLGGARPVPPVLPAPPPSSPQQPLVHDSDAGVVEVQEHFQVTISRAELDRVLSDQTNLLMSARVIPDYENGSVVGLRLYSIRADSFLSRLGFRNADSLRTINGMPMNDPSRALELYSRVRSTDRFACLVLRDGVSVELVIRVLDDPPPSRANRRSRR